MIPKIALLQPQRTVFGRDCVGDCAPYLKRSGVTRAFVVTGPPIRHSAEIVAETIRREGLDAEVYDRVDIEPSISMFRAALDAARTFQANAVVGVGGGSTLDVAKRVFELTRECGVPMNLSDLKVPESAVPRMAESAMQVKRLLVNNPRDITVADAERIYRQAFEARA